MITVFKKYDKTYGGYYYVEVDFNNKVYQSGCSRAHSGHMKGDSIHVEVATKKELKSILKDMEINDFKNNIGISYTELKCIKEVEIYFSLNKSYSILDIDDCKFIKVKDDTNSNHLLKIDSDFLKEHFTMK